MKKLLLIATLGVAGLVSAKDLEVNFMDDCYKAVNANKVVVKRLCTFVGADCGEAGLACGKANSEGTLNWEVIDEMRQLLNETFCGYED